jgi:hypothetical protein
MGKIAWKRYPKTHNERKQNAGEQDVRSKRRSLPTSYDKAGKRGDQRSWKEQRKKQFHEENSMSRAELLERVLSKKGTDTIPWGPVANDLKKSGKPPLRHYVASGASSHSKRLRARQERARFEGGPRIFASRRTDPKEFSKSARRAWKERQRNEDVVTREDLIEAIIQEFVSPVKTSFRLAKHDASTMVNKVKHRVNVMTGKAKPGSHWSSKAE